MRLLELAAASAAALILASVGPSSAADDHDHAMAPGKKAEPADREKMWQTMLAKPSLAVTSTFDSEHRLWQVSLRDRHLYLSHSDDLGATFSAPVQINAEAEAEDILGDGENRPKLIVRGKRIYISYTRGLAQPMSGDIRFTRSLDGGATFSAPITVNDNREIISHRFEAMTVNDREQVALAWLDKRDLAAAQRDGKPYGGAATYYAVSEDGGSTFASNIKAADHSCECCRVAMALAPDGTPVILWRHVFGKNVRDHALMRLDGKSAPARATFDDWEVDGCPHHGPALSISGDGVYHFVWFSNAPAHRGLSYAHSSDGGRSFSAPLHFGNNEAQASHPDVLSRGSAVYLAWKEFDGSRSTVYAMISSDGGNTWGAARALATTSENSDHPFLIADGERVFLSWNCAKEGYRLIEVKR